MSQIPIVYTGDDWDILVTLKVDKVAYDVSAATAISAAIVSTDDSTVTELISATAQSNTGDADWANGIVSCVFAAANTAITTYGRAYLEVQVTLSGAKQTWPRQLIDIKKGIIA